MQFAPKQSAVEAPLTAPSAATVENPFAQRAFIKERESILAGAPREGVNDDGFAYYLFETDSMVSKGHSHIGFTFSFSNPGMMPAFHRSHQYVVDHKQGKIRIGDNLEYYYKFEGPVLQLWNMTQSHTLYEVGSPFFLADQNSVYWQIVRRLDAIMNRDHPRPLKMDYEEQRRHQSAAGREMKNYIDNLIARAKGAPAIPLPDAPQSPQTPTPTGTANISQNVDRTIVVSDENQQDGNPSNTSGKSLNVAIGGLYQGTLTDTSSGSQLKFTMQIETLGHLPGRPAMASVKATMKFEGTNTEEVLAGTAIAGEMTQLVLAGAGARGTVTLNCSLSGNQLTGTWNSQSGDGKSTQGTLQATRTAPY